MPTHAADRRDHGPGGRPDDPGCVERQVDEVECRRPRSGGTSVASRPKTIALTVAVAAPSTDREQGERADRPARAASGAGRRRPRQGRPPGPAGTRSGRRPRPPSGETSPPTRAAVPTTSPIDDASPGPVPAMPSTTTGMYGRLIWIARNEMPKIRKMRRIARSAGRRAGRRRRASTIRPVGTTSGRTSVTRTRPGARSRPTGAPTARRRPATTSRGRR